MTPDTGTTAGSVPPLPDSIPMQSLPQGYRAVVVGAGGAIGSALVAQLQQDPRCAAVLPLGRHTQPALDYRDDSSFERAAAWVATQGPIHLLIVASGMLHDPQGQPEKRLAQLDAAHMMASFQLNTVGPARILSCLLPLLERRAPAVVALLSAKVGSIGDNRLGGWVSYRASKAALNMVVRTVAIEAARTHPQAVLVALHPGTVQSPLSAPFQGARSARPADTAARELLAVLDGLTPADTGTFRSWDGAVLPW